MYASVWILGIKLLNALFENFCQEWKFRLPGMRLKVQYELVLLELKM